MGVIINDFEIVAESPAPTNGSQQGQGKQEQTAMQQAMLRPHDIEEIIRHFKERHARLRAD